MFLMRFTTWVRTKNSISYFLILFAFLSLSYFSFGTYRNWHYKIESDGKYYYQYLVSGFYDKDFDFANNYQTPKYEWMRTEIDHYGFKNNVSPITGRSTNLFTIGPSILWLPFFLVAKISANSLNMIGFQIDVNPWGKFFQYTVMYSAVVYTVITLYLLYRLLIRYFEHNIAIYAAWLLLISTNLFYYTVFEASMSHVYDLFTYVLFLFLFVESVENARPVVYLALAIAGVLHVLVRTQNILTIILFSVLLFLIPLISQKKLPSFKLIGIYGIVLFIGLLPIPLLNIYLFGNPFTIPQGYGFLSLTDPKILQVLFSLRNGLFSQHPSLLLGALGFMAFLYSVIKAKSQKETIFFIALLIAFIFQVYINSTASDWWAGHSFGQRRLISSFPLFAFGFAYIMQRIQRLFPKLNAFGIGVFSISGIYLTFIHVFLWNYDEPHNIFAWMFYYAPQEVLKILHLR